MGLIMALSIGFLCLIEFGDIGIRSFFDRGIGIRKDLWLGTLQRIADSPILGEGYFTDVNLKVNNLELSPHNLLLLVILKSGMIGGGLLLLITLTALVFSFKYFLVSGNWIYISLFAFFIICMTFDSVHLLYKPSLSWLIFWMPVALIAVEENRMNSFNPQLNIVEPDKVINSCANQ